MNKKFFIILLSLLLSLSVFSQRRNIGIQSDTVKTNTKLYTSISFGRDYWGNNFNTQMFGIDYSQMLDNKTTIYFGANLFNISGIRPLKDKAPKRTNTSGSFYLGASYQVNEKLFIYGDVYFCTLYNTIGLDFDLTYKIGEDSFFTFSASFECSQFSTNNQTIPYWNYHTFQPRIFSY